MHAGATVHCSHGGQATPISPSPRLLISGMPAVTVATSYAVTGCAFVPPAGNGPCVSGRWTAGAARVLSQGQPLAVATGMSTCAPTGTPLVVVAAQARVLAT